MAERQRRISRRAEEREHLILQMILLTEQEITAVLGLDRQIIGRVGLTEVKAEEEIEQLSRHTSSDEVAQTLREQLSND